MLDVSFKADFKEVERALTRTQRAELPKATSSTLNKVARTVQKRALKLISKDLGVTQKELRKVFFIKRATWKHLESSIVPKSPKRMSLNRHKPRQTRKGVSYRGKGGKRTLVPGAFIATMPEGGRIVVKRVGDKRVMKKGRYKGKVRQPIAKLHSVSVNYVFIQERINQAMREVARERFDEVWPSEIRHYLRRAGFDV